MIRTVRIADGQGNAQQSTLRGKEGLWDVVSARHAARQELPSTYRARAYHVHWAADLQYPAVMPRKRPNPPAPRNRRRRRRSRGEADSLIDWTAAERNAHVLDWRQRAQEFGFVPDDETDEAAVLPADRLVQEDDPEAFEDQHLDDEDDEPAAQRDGRMNRSRGGSRRGRRLARGPRSRPRLPQTRRQAKAAQGERGTGDRPADRAGPRRAAGDARA